MRHRRAVAGIMRPRRIELHRRKRLGPVELLPGGECETLVLRRRDAALDLEVLSFTWLCQVVHPVLAARRAAEVEELSTPHLRRARLHEAIALAIDRSDEQPLGRWRAEEHRGGVLPVVRIRG